MLIPVSRKIRCNGNLSLMKSSKKIRRLKAAAPPKQHLGCCRTLVFIRAMPSAKNYMRAVYLVGKRYSRGTSNSKFAYDFSDPHTALIP